MGQTMNSHLKLTLSTCRMSRSLPPSTIILTVYIGPNWAPSHISSRWFQLSTMHWSLKASTSKKVPTMGVKGRVSECTFQRWGRSEKIPVAQVQLKGQLVVMFSGWPRLTAFKEFIVLEWNASTHNLQKGLRHQYEIQVLQSPVI